MSAVQAHETADSHDHDGTEEQSGPQHSWYSRAGVQESLIAVGHQDRQLTHKLALDLARCVVRLLATQNAIHLRDRGSCGVACAALVLPVPFRTLHRIR